MVVHVGIDLPLEFSHRLEGAAADRLVGDQRKPTLDLVEPRAIGRGEMDVETWPPREPGTHPWMLVGGVVVADQMHVELGRHVGLDMAQEGQELLMPMSLFALR